MQETDETRVQYLGLEDPLEKGMATHSSILAWRIPWSEELQSMDLQRVWEEWHDLGAAAVFYNLCPYPFVCLL